MVMTNLLRSPGEGRVPGASNGLRLPAFQAIQHLLPAGPLGRKQDACHAPVGVPHEMSLLLYTKYYSLCWMGVAVVSSEQRSAKTRAPLSW